MPPLPSSSSALQWLSLVGIVWLQSINGTNSNFPAYSSQLKNLLSISQLQLNNLAFASDTGKLLGWVSGIAAVYLPLWLVLLIGSTLGLVGYGLQYLFLINSISNLSYAHIFFLNILAGNSICWINTVSYLVSIRNFPLERQVAVGVTTSYLGLSAKIYTDIVNLIFPSSPKKRAKGYLLLSAILPLLVCGITAPMVRYLDVGKGKTKKMRGAFIVMFGITIGTGVYAVLGSLGPISIWFSPLARVIGMGLLLLSPLLIVAGEKIASKLGLDREERVYIEEENTVVEKIENEEESINELRVREEIGVKLMLRRVEFWLYFFVYLFGVTLGLVFLNNLGQIAESRRCEGTSSLVSLSSSFGFFGRLLPSLTDYFFSRSKHMISRPACVAALMVPTAGAFFLLLNPTNRSLYISTAIIGVCTGAITSMSVSITTELFGTKNFGVNHNIVVANIPIGSFLFGYLAAFVYHNQANSAGQCIGVLCYQNTFILWGSLCLLGTLLAFLLHIRTRKFYTP
ncbi:hypothetical protein SLEP1_g21089 [Rubroshorea leprosula]|uniref:Nodulin-like domain-containing protein n=1 Tax=Rubroshorea leprosula TaxID=152421 RepID=A0AAV5JDK9_9ROSI|nr:hypothetical protein SLEP1_g21089 [Rubroshorea leprosula]